MEGRQITGCQSAVPQRNSPGRAFLSGVLFFFFFNFQFSNLFDGSLFALWTFIQFNPSSLQPWRIVVFFFFLFFFFFSPSTNFPPLLHPSSSPPPPLPGFSSAAFFLFPPQLLPAHLSHPSSLSGSSRSLVGKPYSPITRDPLRDSLS